MLISPFGASKLLEILGGEHITLIPSDVLCWISSATDVELHHAFQTGPDKQKDFKSYAANIRLNPNFRRTTCTAYGSFNDPQNMKS